ncbi:MAG: hypothetical protein R2875_05410 [Desulfobacterales bacterium]
MHRIGLRIPRSGIANDMDAARKIAADIGFPIIVRPQFHPGRHRRQGRLAEELEVLAASGLDASMTTQVMLEESVLGWKEYELEVMRDKNDNVVIICSIENMDPWGFIPGAALPWPRPRPDRPGISGHAGCGHCHFCGRSGWRPAAPMCSSPLIRRTGK